MWGAKFPLRYRTIQLVKSIRIGLIPGRDCLLVLAYDLMNPTIERESVF